MLQKYKSKREEGFTIIEVLIVLAIAGLIILIVFLAVPALQRNSRNTQRKNDVSGLLGAVQEFTNNNAGSVPAAAGDFTGNVKLGFYQATDVNYAVNGAAGTSVAGTDTSKVYIETFRKCDGNAVGPAANATKRNVIAVYYVETAGGTPQMQCQDM